MFAASDHATHDATHDATTQVLHELHARGGLHIVRATCAAPSGKLQLV